jgi:hypothetical protein
MEFNNDNEAKRGEQMIPQPINRILCPFVRSPFVGCYCASTSSLYTEATIHYCGGNFEKCEIYEKNTRSGETGE